MYLHKETVNKTLNYLRDLSAVDQNPYIDGKIYMFLNEHDNFVSMPPVSYTNKDNKYTHVLSHNERYKHLFKQLDLNKGRLISVCFFYHSITWTGNKFSHNTSDILGHNCLVILHTDTLELLDSDYSNTPEYNYLEQRLLLGINIYLTSIYNKKFKYIKSLSSLLNCSIQDVTNTLSLCTIWPMYFGYLLKTFDMTGQQLVHYLNEHISVLLHDFYMFVHYIYVQNTQAIEDTPIQRTFI